jgi:protein-tyrosine phosphatase
VGEPPVPPRSLSWDGFLNVRDLGGLPMRGGGETARGRVARSESPGFLSEQGWRELADHGIRTIVDLRCPTEPPYEPRDGVVREPVPMFRFDDEALTARLEGVRDSRVFYRVLVDYCHAPIARAVAAVGDAPSGGVLVHCQAGRDRTGIVTAFLLALAGVPDEEIVADYLATEAALRTRREEELEAAATEEERDWIRFVHRVRADSILGALDAAGDVREYLREGGASEDQLEWARARFVA